MSESPNLLRNFDNFIINQLKESYKTKSDITNLKGVSLFHEPFTHCVINDLVSDSNFVNDLNAEIVAKLKYHEKNNDLYKFHQTKDLGKNKSKHLSQFRDQFLYGQFLDFLKQMTDIDLSSTKIDVTSSKYEHTDYLLCHDDNINKDLHGRRIAFIYYLVPDDWNSDGSDGGNLDLFSVNDKLEPIDIVKSLIPKRNSLAFFEVSDRSFHQVAEVLAKNKTRLSINGWFHGPVNPKAVRKAEIPQELSSYQDVEPDQFFDWITEKYLKPINQTGIQMKFSSSSEIKLDKIFHNLKYEQTSKELESENIKWIRKGPYNRRNYEIADPESLPDIVKELSKVLTSDFMGLTLSNMTGLALHASVPKNKPDDDDNDEDDYSDEEDEENECENGEDDEFESDFESEVNANDVEPSENKRKLEQEEENDGSKPCSSSSLNKKLKSTESEQEVENTDTQTNSENVKNIEEPKEYGNPKFHCEVRRWKQGEYTLITDDDDDIKKEALDLMLFFGCKNWSINCGGNISYIARDEDSELLTVNPEENCMALVYRDTETLRFTKFVNSELNKINSNGCFYEIYIVYYE
ncbi:unnamed protein product [Brachionus calyciflorus]|uniref:uS12 prolyl 3-hydroxylase n=1 Tax=Brachionus calyciflorus TaxID=104777 RepID=A0A814A4K6_9BILA|nr:unnamed protein product [Brachionus calyciflorus]